MDLIELREIAAKERARQKNIRVHCCTSTGCQASNSVELKKNLETAATEAGLDATVEVVGVGCMGFCGRGPLVQIDPDNILYEEVKPEQATLIIDALKNNTEADLLKGDPNHPFFSRQVQIVRENSGKIDPERIEEYIAVGGYESLYKVIHDMSPAEVVQEITKSGLRGRGGGGFPTGLKWATDRKSVV